MNQASLTTALRETLAVFDSSRPLTTSEVTDELDVGRRSTYDRLTKLVEYGRLETKEVGARGRVWWQTQDELDTEQDEAPDDAEPTDEGEATNELLSSLVDAVDEYAIFLLNRDGEIETWNPGAERIKGYQREEIVGEHFSTFYTEEAIADDVPEQNLAAAAEHGSVEDTGWRVRKDGSRFWANVTITAIRDDDGDIEGYAKVTRDMSDRRRFEERLRRQRDSLESELDEVFERVDDAFFALDENWQVTYVTERMAELVDQSADQMLGDHIGNALPAFDEGEPRLIVEEAIESQESVEFEFSPEQMDRCLQMHVHPSETGLSVYVRDITERKEREQHLEQYETVAQSASDVIITTDTESTIQRVNPAVEDVFGYEPSELVGEPITELMPERVVEEFREEIRHYLDTGERKSDWENLERTGKHADGHEIPVAISFSEYEYDGERFFTAIVRDVTQRTKREEQLRTQFRQQEAISDLGRLALEADDIDALMAEVSERVAETLDNDYCKVLDFDPDDDELLLRQGVGWRDGLVGDATVSASEADSQAAYTLSSDEPIVVTDLETEYRFSGPDLLRNHDVRAGISVVIGPHDDPWGILGTHDTEHREFSTQDVNFVQSVANILATAINRHDDEQELRRQREQLQALNSLNDVARDVTDVVIEQSTREEIEQAVCEQLAATDSYEFAWIGDVNMPTETVEHRAEAGVDGYLDDTTISIASDDSQSQGPTSRAVQTKEMQVVEDALTDESYEEWRDNAREYGFVTSAAIPIVHENTIYGVLNVYSGRPEAFTGKEGAILSQLGEGIGHAIAAVERKRALMSDEIVELEFVAPDAFAELDVPTAGRFEVTKTVPTSADEYLVYGTADADGADVVEGLTEALPHWEDLLFLDESEDDCRFQVRVMDPTVLAMVASQGGSIDHAVYEDGDFELRFHLGPGTEVRQVIDTVQAESPSAEMVSRRQTTRSEEGSGAHHRSLESELTDKQHTTLEAAYNGGFFEWPRVSSGEELADAMDVAPPTFHQHLRKAEQKVLASVLSESER